MADFSHVAFISAGAGSGKTWRLTEALEGALTAEGVDPAHVIGTTFTVKAAGELRDRVRERLIAGGRVTLAEQTAQALIGTVHSVCERLLQRFAFERGLSPRLQVLSVEDGQRLFNEALDDVLASGEAREMNAIAARLGVARWQGAVKNVVDKARENAIDADALAAMGAANADDLLAFFPEPEAEDLSENLRTAVQSAVAGIDVNADRTATTRKYLAELQELGAQLGHPQCPWATWLSLANRKPAKASAKFAARVQEAAHRYDRHPGLHADLRKGIESVFDIAARAMRRFQALKRQAGLIDFADMESLLLAALDDPNVAKRLAEGLELLLVDEFQDTNPMQLALFVKLAQLARRAIFVGDVKQAIYQFRGCDQQLVFNALRELAAGDAATTRLERNWRSRPPLVRYVNEVFAAAFAKDGMERADVVLKPQREEQTLTPAVARWMLPGARRKRAADCAALASGIAELVQSGCRVIDPRDGGERPVRCGDIAVLARTNDHVDEVASALQRQRVPTKMTLRGLLDTTETGLARACLRCLNDDSDTLAAAEVMALADGEPAETWLADRLQWLEAGKPPWDWGAEHPIVGRLRALRGNAASQSPAEAAAQAITDICLREIVAGWGPDAPRAAQRQRNLDAFLDLAGSYEAHCEALGSAATLTGFLFWLDAPRAPELDLQPVIPSGDAVHVLTYHRAKGLEWPVVIAADFDYEERLPLWDVRIKLLAPFDVRAPLAGRMVRWWPNIFGERTRSIAVRDAIHDSPEAVECAQASASEQRRLAYVGMTRARDSLIITLPQNVKESAWLHAFNSPFLLPDSDALTLPSGRRAPAATLTLAHTDAADAAKDYAPRWFETRRRQPPGLPATLPASGTAPAAGAAAVETVAFGKRIPLRGDDMASIGNALHGIIAMCLINPHGRDNLQRAQRILEAREIAAALRAEDAIAAAERFRAWLQEKFAPRRIHVEYPIRQALDGGQVRTGKMDVLLETDSAAVVIDHKSFPRPRSEWAAEALKHSGQLNAYAEALRAAGRKAETWIHFPITGGAVRVCCNGAAA